MSGVTTRYVDTAEKDLRLDRWFKVHFPDVGFGQLQKLLRTGQIRVDGKRVKAGLRLEPGQAIRIPPLGDGQREHVSGGARSLSEADKRFMRGLVIYRDKDIIAINKPAGLAVQGGTKTERHLDGMLDALSEEGGERPRLVHRLDRDTSGVMLLANTREAATKLGLAFKSKETRKVYWAITKGVPSPREGEIDMPLAKGGGPGQERVFADQDEGKTALTWYSVMDTAGNRAALVALWPRTGRTHQLRAHMAGLGTPILGDGKYGGREAFLEGAEFERKMHLHAREIDIPLGRGTGSRLKAALSDHMKATIALLGLDPDIAEEDPFEGWKAPKSARKRG